MDNLVKVKANTSFQDTTYGDIAAGEFKRVSREKADHYIANGLAEEINVQNKMQPVKVTETKPAKLPAFETKKKSGVVKNGNSKPSRSKGTPARNKRR